MGLLSRKVEQLLSDLEDGKLHLSAAPISSDFDQLKLDLERVRKLENGEVDLHTCSDLVKSASRSLALARQVVQEGAVPPRADDHGQITKEQVETAQRQYFRIIGDFFEGVTECPAERYCQGESFGHRIKKDVTKTAVNLEKRFPDFLAATQVFYRDNASLLMRGTKLYSGLTAVVGGTTRFPETAFDGYRKMALYADTVFIPDPVLPWLETEREHEQFRHVKMLESCHDILQLRPLTDADLPDPAALVFPSWEKSLEEKDVLTKDGIGELALAFFSHYLGARFEDESEILEFVTGSGKEAFRDAVNRHRLFIPPEAGGAMSVDEGVALWHQYNRRWRTKEYCEGLEGQSNESLAWLAIMERLAPQFHIRDNARMIGAQPLLWHPNHYHYFNLCANATNEGLEQEKVIDRKTVTLLAALNQPSLAWLGNVGIHDLVRLRQANANEKLRKELATYIRELADTGPDALNRVAADVGRGLASLLTQHAAEAESLWHAFKKQLALDGTLVVTAGVALSAWLAGASAWAIPGLGGMAASGGNLLKDTIHYGMDRSRLSRSMMGILSAAKSE